MAAEVFLAVFLLKSLGGGEMVNSKHFIRTRLLMNSIPVTLGGSTFCNHVGDYFTIR